MVGKEAGRGSRERKQGEEAGRETERKDETVVLDSKDEQ